MSTVLGSLAGFLASHLLPPQYSARAVMDVSEFPSRHDLDSEQKLALLAQLVFSLNRLPPQIERKGIAKPKGVKKAYEEIRKNTKLHPASADSAASSIDLVYADSTPERAELVCNVLTSIVLEENRNEDQAAMDSSAALAAKKNLPVAFIGPSDPIRVGVISPCKTAQTHDFPNRFHCAAIGSAIGLSTGIALIAIWRKSLDGKAEPHPLT